MSGATSYNTCTCVIAGGSDQSQNTGQLYADQCFDNMARVNPPPPADVPDVWQLKGICADEIMPEYRVLQCNHTKYIQREHECVRHIEIISVLYLPDMRELLRIPLTIRVL